MTIKTTPKKTGLFQHHTNQCCRSCGNQDRRHKFLEMGDTHKLTYMCMDCFKKMILRKMKKSGHDILALNIKYAAEKRALRI